MWVFSEKMIPYLQTIGAVPDETAVTSTDDLGEARDGTTPLTDDFDAVRDIPDFHLDHDNFIRDYLDEEALSLSMKNLNVVCREHDSQLPLEK
ncbi:hypothetical protein ANCCEY_09679 [Ancylostoma ceylanicum]|uniref:Uncharacterized protein n=1 Tax=Ancylostoma ceylanicum TaxID=53326 RepID=A0A0D6LME6_9BILA|nr:hypothetical protein ANCCEY_09679 [Ancylostoma ceylanicum]